MTSLLPLHDVDGLVRYYVVLGELMTAWPARPLDLGAVPVCARCGGGPMTIRTNGDHRPGRLRRREVCFTCDKPWREKRILRRADPGPGPPCALCDDGEPMRKGRRVVCSNCGQPWSPRGSQRRSSHSSARRLVAGDAFLGERLDDWWQVRPLVENRPPTCTRARWDFSVVALLAYLDRSIGSYERVASWGRGELSMRRLEPCRLEGSYWTPARVRTGIGYARNAIRARGERRGVLLRGGNT
jgi:hypothetical protein